MAKTRLFIFASTLAWASVCCHQTHAQFGFDFFGGSEKKATESTPKSVSTASEPTAEEIDEFLKTTAKSYSFEVASDPLEFRSEPLLNWQNPTRLSEQGLFYTWTHQGRPLVLGCYFTFKLSKGVRTKHELISLTDQSVEGKIDGTVVWKPSKPIANWSKLESDLPPSDSPARRKLQFSQLSRRFTAQHVAPSGDITELRRLTQPIVRYKSPEQGVIDGVIFPMVIATDPEVFLIMEARKAGDKEATWHYTYVPSHYHELRGELDGEPVWNKPLNMVFEGMRQGQQPAMYEPYCSFYPTRALE